ncbi:MAG: helix-turn-helix domain-containing protein [Hymenobacter sp.]
MKSVVPVYCLDSYPRSRLASPFYVQPLEELVATFRGIDAPHTHDFYMVMYVTHGTGTHTIDFTTYAVQPDRLFFLAPGQVHSWVLAGDVRGYVLFFEAEYFLFRFPGNQLYEYLFFSNFYSPLLDVAGAEQVLLPLVQGLAAEFELREAQWLEAGRSYLHLLLETAARRYHPTPTPEARRSAQQVRAFEHLVNQHFRTDKEVQAYAARLCLTANHLNVLCRQQLGKTASTLITERVVLEAKRLLVHSPQPVRQIGYALGFEDPSYFTRFFRKHTQQVPEVFRRESMICPS